MKPRIESRNPIIDIERCVENVGGRYDLVILASQKLRTMRRKNKDPNKLITCIDALKEIQEGKLA